MADVPDPAIRLAGVTKTFGERTILRDLDVAVAPGEKVSLIGPSGSGKTTVLRLIMTLERPDAGDILVDGESMYPDGPQAKPGRAEHARLRRLRTNIGMVFQSFNLFPHMTVLDNITEAPRSVLGLSTEEAVVRARRLLGLVGLEGYETRYPQQLSGGQQQRVAIARALAMQPRVMLFDEITSALDPELVDEVLAVVRHLAQETAMAMLLVTHEMRFAREISDRVLMFDGGQVVEQGPPSQIFGAPEQQRTREFLRAVLER